MQKMKTEGFQSHQSWHKGDTLSKAAKEKMAKGMAKVPTLQA
jgi:hypothetical protein